MYLDYYGLIEKPFSLTPDPKYFFASGCHAEARDLLRYGVREREGFMCFVGAAGTGKTTLLRTVLESFGEEVVTALVLNPFLSEEDLLRIILVDLGAATKEQLSGDSARQFSKQALIDRLNNHLMKLSMQGKVAVLVIDEAQNLPMPVMEQIRLLSNLETSKSKLLQIVLAGQLGLRRNLQAPELSQLAQRVSVRYTLQALTAEDIGRYIDHRLRIAGSGGEIVFDESAVQAVFRYSEGVPRLVNLVCDRTLLAGYAQRTVNITAAIVDRAAETLDLADPGVAPPVERAEIEPSLLANRVSWAVPKVAGALTLAVAMAVGGAWTYANYVRPATPATPRAAAEAAVTVPELEPVPTQPPGAQPAGTEAPTSAPVDLARPAGSFTVYLSSYRSRDEEQLTALREQLRTAGHTTYLISAHVPGQGTLHRLTVGDFADQSSARAAAARLAQELGIAHAEAVAVADVTGS